MASYEEVRPLPKFGEWDVADPALAERFLGIFNRARNEKVARFPSSGNARSMRRHARGQGRVVKVGREKMVLLGLNLLKKSRRNSIRHRKIIGL